MVMTKPTVELRPHTQDRDMTSADRYSFRSYFVPRMGPGLYGPYNRIRERVDTEQDRSATSTPKPIEEFPLKHGAYCDRPGPTRSGSLRPFSAHCDQSSAARTTPAFLCPMRPAQSGTDHSSQPFFTHCDQPSSVRTTPAFLHPLRPDQLSIARPIYLRSAFEATRLCCCRIERVLPGRTGLIAVGGCPFGYVYTNMRASVIRSQCAPPCE
ncbi:hypothetical protein J6590_001761 [Homalodisca vitripennis]|nr:hypothetical protein J6590_001761 [Homalodisca vitripennis]